jgi:type I restriction enzyme, S subunit
MTEHVMLNTVLTPIKRTVSVDPQTTYALLGARWYAKGLFIKERKLGQEIGADRLYRIESGDFVYNRLFAWKGSFAVATEEHDGCFVSSEFPTFAVDSHRLNSRYLHLYFSREAAWREALGLSTGSTPTSRNRLKEDKFLAMKIPLPSLEKQRRTVQQIDTLSRKIEEALHIRREAQEELDNVLTAAEMRIWPADCLKDALPLDQVTTYLARGRQSQQGESEHFLIKTRHVQMHHYVTTDMTLAPRASAMVSQEAIAQAGDVLIACSAAGCLGRVAQFVDDGRMSSTDTHVAIARADRGQVIPEYLYAYLSGAQGQVQLRSRERGDWTRNKVGFRLTELNVADLRRVPIPMPSLPEQAAIATYLNNLRSKVGAAKQLQLKVESEVEALLPSVLDREFKETM